MKMSNEAYDIWNKIQRWLPAVGVLYLAISQIWSLPFGDKINDTIVAICSFLASILEISSKQFYKEQAKTQVNDYDVSDPNEGIG